MPSFKNLLCPGASKSNPKGNVTFNSPSLSKSSSLTLLSTCCYYYCYLAALTSHSWLPVESSTHVVRPSSGKATLIPGQPLHMQCETLGAKTAQYYW